MSAHPHHRIHPHSVEAYRDERPNLSQRASLIVDWLVRRGSPASDRQIMEGLGFADMNAVRPRITELLAAGVLMDAGEVIDQRTGKVVRLVDVSKPPKPPVSGGGAPADDFFPSLGVGARMLR